MSTSINSPVGNLTNVANNVAQLANSLSQAGNVADVGDLWPIQNLGSPNRLTLAGIPNIESVFHYPFEQGRFLESSIGDAISSIEIKKQDLEEKIQHYLSLNRLAIDGQLPDTPRAIKYAADSILFIQQIQAYVNEISGLLNALQANVMVLLSTEARMISMIQANLNALSNLLQQICNWGLPNIASMAAQIEGLFHWNGFNFNSFAGFHFNSNLAFNFNFSFSQCTLQVPNFASFFNTPSSSSTPGTLSLPLSGIYSTPADYAIPSYIAQMQSTTTPVFDPNIAASNGTSLPSPSSIVSNYQLSPATYASNVISLVPSLQPVIIPAGSAESISGPSVSRETSLRSLCTLSVNLENIVASNYDPNLTAAWLFYLNLNRIGRGGLWLSNFQALYASEITPSLTYLANNPVPFNAVLGGTGVSDAPTSIPLITALQQDTTNNLKWKLSYIEASLLGYGRARVWDTAADNVFTSTFTGTDTDYLAATSTSTSTTTVSLGTGQTLYPVACTYPSYIATNFAQVVTMASAAITNTPSYQTTRPQFRFIYDQFGQAQIVDRFAQFWRDFNANLTALLAMDPYVVAFVLYYPATLNSALNPLADASIASTVENDAATRNRNWLPGTNLLPIPTALSLTSVSTPPTTTTSGWTNGIFDSNAFLARPDIQAQPVTVQTAMLKTNQNYASLLTLQGNIQSAVSAAVAASNQITQTVGIPGWQADTNATIPVSPGASGTIISFSQVIFDQTNYITDPADFTIQSSGSYIINAVLNWDPIGPSGTRTVNLLQNGSIIATAFSDDTTATPYVTQFATLTTLNQDDVIQVQATHSLTTPQNVLSGSTILGLADTSSDSESIQLPNNSVSTASSATSSFVSGAAFAINSAVSVAADGYIYATNPNTTSGVPFVEGIATQSSTAAAEVITVVTTYGTIQDTTGTNWTTGSLLYVAADGTLTQDYSSLMTTVKWVICVGKALSPESFIFQPHIPTNFVKNW